MDSQSAFDLHEKDCLFWLKLGCFMINREGIINCSSDTCDSHTDPQPNRDRRVAQTLHVHSLLSVGKAHDLSDHTNSPEAGIKLQNSNGSKRSQRCPP
jgi:hypothetical protein